MREILDQRRFNLSETPVTIGTLLVVAAIFVGGLLISWVLRRALGRAFAKRGVEEGTFATIQRLTRYLLFILTIGIAFDTLGVNLGALFAAGALFAVGIGLAMQNISQNFVSGLILLIERAIKAGGNSVDERNGIWFVQNTEDAVDGTVRKTWIVSRPESRTLGKVESRRIA